MGCGAAEATGLGFVCFVVSTLVFCQPTELIWAFLFRKFSILLPPLQFTPSAVRYNDRNVLENHHASTGWTLLFKVSRHTTKYITRLE